MIQTQLTFTDYKLNPWGDFWIILLIIIFGIEYNTWSLHRLWYWQRCFVGYITTFFEAIAFLFCANSVIGNIERECWLIGLPFHCNITYNPKPISPNDQVSRIAQWKNPFKYHLRAPLVDQSRNINELTRTRVERLRSNDQRRTSRVQRKFLKIITRFLGEYLVDHESFVAPPRRLQLPEGGEP